MCQSYPATCCHSSAGCSRKDQCSGFQLFHKEKAYKSLSLWQQQLLLHAVDIDTVLEVCDCTWQALPIANEQLICWVTASLEQVCYVSVLVVYACRCMFGICLVVTSPNYIEQGQAAGHCAATD